MRFRRSRNSSLTINLPTGKTITVRLLRDGRPVDAEKAVVSYGRAYVLSKRGVIYSGHVPDLEDGPVEAHHTAVEPIITACVALGLLSAERAEQIKRQRDARREATHKGRAAEAILERLDDADIKICREDRDRLKQLAKAVQ